MSCPRFWRRRLRTVWRSASAAGLIFDRCRLGTRHGQVRFPLLERFRLHAEAAEATEATEATEEVEADTQSSDSTPRTAFDLGGVSRQLGGVIGTTSTVLSSVTNEASATAALPTLEEARSSLEGLAETLGSAPESAKGPMQRVISNGVARLQPLADTALTKAGVGPVLSPVVEPILEMMKSLAE